MGQGTFHENILTIRRAAVAEETHVELAVVVFVRPMALPASNTLTELADRALPPRVTPWATKGAFLPASSAKEALARRADPAHCLAASPTQAIRYIPARADRPSELVLARPRRLPPR